MLLELAQRLAQLLIRARKHLGHRFERLRRANARDDVLTLRVCEELAVELFRARRWVARERHTRAGTVALVAEHHLDHVHCSADVVRDVVRAPVDLRTRCIPRVEDRSHRAQQLLGGALRKGRIDLLERRDELLQVVSREVGVLPGATRLLQVAERVLEEVLVDAVDDLAEHLQQAPVGVEGEAAVAGARGEPLDRLVVQAEVQDRVHHPGHRHGRARADGDEQRVARVAEALAGLPLEPADVIRDFLLEAGRQIAGAHVRATCVGGDRKARRHRQTHQRHLGEPDPLPAE